MPNSKIDVEAFIEQRTHTPRGQTPKSLYAVDVRELAQQYQAEIDRRDVELALNKSVFALAGADIVFFQDDGTPYVLCSDTFGYACADAEPLPTALIPELMNSYTGFGHDGVTAWCAKQRQCEPIAPLITEKYLAAKAALSPKGEDNGN